MRFDEQDFESARGRVIGQVISKQAKLRSRMQAHLDRIESHIKNSQAGKIKIMGANAPE